MTAKPAAPPDAMITLDVSLLGRDYKVSCGESERLQLLDAVSFLDRRMREIRDTAKIAGSERIAVMAALNLTHELLRARAESTAAKADRSIAPIDDAAVRRRIGSMQSAIDQALAEQVKQARGAS